MKWRSVYLCLSVCLSVFDLHVTRQRKKTKTGVMEAHHKSNPWTYLKVKRSKVKVTRPINAVRDNAAYGDRREFPWRKSESESVFHWISNRSRHNNILKIALLQYRFVVCTVHTHLNCYWFLSRVSTPIDARYWYSNSICLSVRPSVRLSIRHTLVSYQNGWTYCYAFFTTR